MAQGSGPSRLSREPWVLSQFRAQLAGPFVERIAIGIQLAQDDLLLARGRGPHHLQLRAGAAADHDARGGGRLRLQLPQDLMIFGTHCEYRDMAMSTISSTSWLYVRPALRAAIASSARDASHGLGFTSMTVTVPSGFSRMSTRP